MNDQPRIVILEFWNETRIKDGVATDDVWVKYAPSHSVQNTQTCEAVRRLIPNDKVLGSTSSTKANHMNYIWDQIRPGYEAFLKGETIAVDGTPLSVMTALNKAAISVLSKSGITTVEALSEMTDVQCDKVQLPHVRKTRNQALKVLKGLESSEAVQKAEAQEEKMAEMQRRMDAMAELLEEKEASKPFDPEVEDLKRQCDEAGISYHHKAGKLKLTELLNQEAA